MPKVYPDEEIERGLQMLALCGGSERQAARELAAVEGPSIPRSTLAGWRVSYARRLEDIRAEVLPRLRERIAAESEALAVDYADAERQVMTRFLEELKELGPKDAAGALRNLATARGISTDKASALRGLPTEVREIRSAAEILAEMRRRTDAIDSTAEEVTDAVVVGDERDALPSAAER